ncbi:MAG TPA: hypothetical protein VGB83_09065 [Actinomycetota bacterium]
MREHRRAFMRGPRAERGSYAVLFAVMILALMSVVALAIDLSDARTSVRGNQTIADFAAFAAGAHLPGDPLAACEAAWTYLEANLSDLPAGATSPCDSGVPAAFVIGCDAATPSRAYQALGEEPFEITFTYPVDDGDVLLEGRTSSNDGERCERFGIRVLTHRDALFGGVVGSSGLTAPADAVVRGFEGTQESDAVALLLLDPYGCEVLVTSGQAAAIVFAHDADNPGRIAVDSSGTKPGNPNQCTNNNHFTVNANDNASARIWACSNAFDLLNPSSCDGNGIISMFAMAAGQVGCVNGLTNHACDPADESAGRLDPTPTRATNRATRAPVDHEWNCQTNYPGYKPYSDPAIPVRDCETGVPNYIDDLKAMVGMTGNSMPFGVGGGFASYNAWYAAQGFGGNACTNQPANTTVPDPRLITDASLNLPAAGWYVDCGGPNGFSINFGAGEHFTFAGGNLVFRGNVGVQGGTLRINQSNSVTDISAGCRRPNELTIACALESSEKAAWMVLRNDGVIDTANAASVLLQINHTAVILDDGGTVNLQGQGNLNWTAPHQADSPAPGDAGHPFDKLALWSGESNLQHNLKASGTLTVEGVFFTPYALFNYDGQADQFLNRAQFLTFRMNISGQATLRMEPDPDFTLLIPQQGWELIR